jgi:hypothetical protein
MPKSYTTAKDKTIIDTSKPKRLRVEGRKSTPIRLSDGVIDALEEIRDIYQAGFCDQMDTEEVTQLSINDVIVGLIIATMQYTNTVLKTDLSNERMIKIAAGKEVF